MGVVGARFAAHRFGESDGDVGLRGLLCWAARYRLAVPSTLGALILICARIRLFGTLCVLCGKERVGAHSILEGLEAGICAGKMYRR